MHGNVAEDLRSQVLGQLSERLSYDRLYQEALSDPELRRTRFELEAALSNASEARKVVFELFQDLEGFSLEEYKPFADVGAGMDRLVRFLTVTLEDSGRRIVAVGDGLFEIRTNNGSGSTPIPRFTTQREVARQRAELERVPLILGSATPTLESFLKVLRKEDILLSLPKRASAGTSTPSVETTSRSTVSHAEVA